MLRRMISVVLLCVICIQLVLHVGADEIISEDIDVVFVHDSEKNDRIEELFELRGELELDFDLNREKIEEIDNQLNLLGVQQVSAQEIMNKVGISEPQIDIPSTDTVRWTSRRLVVTFNGQHYELQIYEAVASDEESPLLSETTEVHYKAEGVQAGLVNAMKIIGAEAWGAAVDELCDVEELIEGISILNALLTIEEIADEFKASLSTSTVLDHVSATSCAMVSTRMRYIFVKPYQSQDYGNQLLSYVGNVATYSITTVFNEWTFTDTDAIPKQYSLTVPGKTYSPYYDDFSVPARIHYNYRYNGITTFNEWFYLRELEFEFFNQQFVHEVPNVGMDSDLI